MKNFFSDNNSYIKLLAKRSYNANKKRNLFVVLALMLTTFMITSIFSLGFSYFETLKKQQIRYMGTTADAAITNITKTQEEELNSSGLISIMGISQRLGNIDATENKDIKLGLTYIDKEEWEKHRKPTVSNITGSYPEEENEVMCPIWALNELGINNPKIGMKITLPYRISKINKVFNKDFILSGYYNDYTTTRVGKRGSVYVSKIFADKIDLPFEDRTSAMITFNGDEKAEHSLEKLKSEIDFSEKQSFQIVPSKQGDNFSIVLSCVALIFIIMVSGYLLIYNILYISISRDTRFYGQLKTIGFTKKQIKKVVKWQILRLSSIGIPIGLLLGCFVSLFVVPFAMRMLSSSNAELGTKISFSPIIFIGAGIFALLTAIIGSMKPARVAGKVSPITASRYIDKTIKTPDKRRSHQIKLSRMAFRNIFRNPKSAMLTFGSLFLGLTMFLISTGLLSSLNPKNFVSEWGESDYALTYSIHEESELLTSEMAEKIKEIKGVKNVRLTYASSKIKIPVIYDQKVFGKYIESLDSVSGLDFSDPKNVKKYTDNFFSGVYGIDEKYVKELNETLKNPIDLKAFENGEIVLLSSMTDNNGNPLISQGESITIVGEDDKKHTLTVANGFLDADFQSGRGIERGTAPNLYISQQALKKFFPNTKIFRIAFDIDEGVDNKQIDDKLQKIISSSQVNIQSRYEKYKEIEQYLFTSRVLATGTAIVFLIIGIMNFINTMVVSVDTRKQEFATLESIGMSKKQIKTVLLYEGWYYWIISFLLLGTIGTGIYIPIYMSFKKIAYYSVFSYPIYHLLIVGIITLILCLTVPIIIFNIDLKKTIIERLRQN